MNVSRQQLALNIIRIAAAGNMLIHGIARIVIDGVIPFDGYLSGLGFPPYTAWAITAFEIVAATLILFNRWTFLLSLIFIVELLMGIILVHYPSGWFVVGAGRNGMEYSVLLILAFAATALSTYKRN